MVKPTTATPSTSVGLSNLDKIMPFYFHIPYIYFYHSTGAADFFDPAALRAALSRTLVEFYPVAGRLSEDVNGHAVIKCSGEGVLFVEEECDGDLDDISGFTPTPRVVTGLVPKMDYSQGISSYPLLLVQVTRFRCGGVCLGTAGDHVTMDGFSTMHLIRSWAEIARGGDITVKPFFDRGLLAARNLSLRFPHVEYLPPPLLENFKEAVDITERKFSAFMMTRHQLNSLKAKCQREAGVRHTTYEALADGRSRLRPPLPSGYFGNVVFKATTVALCGELESNPLEFAVRKVHDAISRMDDEYLRSAIDHLEICGELDPITRGAASYKCSKLEILSWARFGFYEADFGWGRPAHLGYPSAPSEGLTMVLPTPADDGSLIVAIVLPEEQMVAFEKLFYHEVSST